MAELRQKQKTFADKYLIDPNATKAYKETYGVKSDATAAVNGRRLLSNANISSYIAERQAKIAKKFEITQEEVLREYARIAFSDIREFYNADGSLKSIKDLSDDAAAALAGVEVDEIFDGSGKDRMKIGNIKKIKRWDKVKALEGIGRHLGMFNDKLKLEAGDELQSLFKTVMTKDDSGTSKK